MKKERRSRSNEERDALSEKEEKKGVTGMGTKPKNNKNCGDPTVSKKQKQKKKFKERGEKTGPWGSQGLEFKWGRDRALLKVLQIFQIFCDNFREIVEN